MPGRTDMAARLIHATPEAVYAALVDPDQLVRWLPPTGMTAEIRRLEPRPGGAYQVEMHYAISGPGKSTADTDVVDGVFLEVVPAELVVQQFSFEADDPALQGTMTMTWGLVPSVRGTEVRIICENVPPGIGAGDHAAGLRSSLENLANWLETPAVAMGQAAVRGTSLA